MPRSLRFWVLLLASAFVVRAATTAAPDVSRFEGTWLGEVIAPNARTEIGFAFRATDQGLIAIFHMPAMFIERATLGPAELAGAELRFPPLNTILGRDGDQPT